MSTNRGYKVGLVYNKLQILDYLTECGKYVVKCTLCDAKFKVQTISLQDNKNHCTNKSCINYGRLRRDSLIGSVIHGLKCIDYINTVDLFPNDKMTYGLRIKCLSCNNIFTIRPNRVSEFRRGLCSCINPYCNNSNKSIKDGVVYNNFKFLERLDTNRVSVQCLSCNKVFSLNRDTFTSGKAYCKNLGCINHKTGKNIGQVFKNKQGVEYRIISYRGNRSVDVCFEDNTEVKNVYYKSVKSGLRHPTLLKGGSGNIFGSFRINKLAYKLKNGDCFYLCECTKCGLKDILTPSEMLQHKC